MPKLWEMSKDASDYKDGHREYSFHCPGCGHGHRFITQWSKEALSRPGNHPIWHFNGDLERPTFNPSLLHYASGNSPLCHLFLRDGVLEFLPDCTHDYKSKRFKLPDISEE